MEMFSVLRVASPHSEEAACTIREALLESERASRTEGN
jgi:hypothetical protein